MSESLTEFVQFPRKEKEVINIKDFIKYLTLYTFNCMLNDAENKERENYELFLSEPENKEYLYKFISDPQISTLTIRQIKREEDDESDADFYFQLSNEIVLDLNKSQTLIFIKTTQIIEAAKLISSQIQIVNYSSGSPFESMHALVHHGLLPFYKSYIKMISKDNKTLNEKMTTNVERRMIDLEIGLLNLKQNTEIPEIILTTHPYVLKVIQEKASENQIGRVSDFEDKFEDSQFLNQLQSGVMRWIKEIQKVTKLHRDSSSGTTLQEITFWLNFEQSLIRIQEKRESLEVSLTLGILKQAKRFHATKSFDTDTALCDALNTARNYNQLMKDFPINNLLSANNLEEINEALKTIFSHLKKITMTEYPVNKTIELMEALSRDLTTQMMEVIGTINLMDMPFYEFGSIINNCQKVFITWENEFDKIQSFLREMARKRWEGFGKFAWKMNATHKKLQIRLENIKRFRDEHEQLRKVVIRVLKLTTKTDPVNEQFSDEQKVIVALPKEIDRSSINQIDVAYEIVNSIDYLDFANGETSEWDAAVRRYEEKIDRIESQIALNLRDLLGKSKNANEMFRYFSRFNALLVRPHIRGAVGEYQSQLIQRIKEDIESLQTKFKTHYTNGTVYRMSTIRNFPPVSGTIIWIRQIRNQLNSYMRRVESVLGKDWDKHIEGQRLKVVGETFKVKLNVDALFKLWLESVSLKSLSVSGSVFNVEIKFLSAIQDNSASKKSFLKLKVNFNPEIITLSKEVRNMRDLGFPVPFSLVSKANTAKELYPLAISLIDNIKTYELVLRKIDEHKMQNLSILTSGLHFEVQRFINKGIKATWKHKKLDIYVQTFAERVFSFQDKVEDLIQTVTEIYVNVYALETCTYSTKSFQELILNIQKGVDNINFHQFTNLSHWVSLLEDTIETKLAMRLEAGLIKWTLALRGNFQEINIKDKNADSVIQDKMGGSPEIKDIILELKITNRKLELIPSIEHATRELLERLSSWQAVILDLPRIVHSRYQVGLQINSAKNETYKDLQSKLGRSGQSMDEAYAAIFQTIKDAEEFIKQWKNYQSLWDLQSDQLFSQISDNLIVWINVLNEIKKLRKNFDVAETQKRIGPLLIVFGKVRSKVSIKYDSWHKEVSTKFGSSLGKMMSTLYSDMRQARNELEKQSLDLGSTIDCVNFIIYTQNILRKVNQWEKQNEICRDGQNLLFRDRFEFPSNWIDSDNIKGEWNAFKDIIKRKQEMISVRIASLQMKVVEEDKIIELKTSEMLNIWEKEKPIAGELIPKEAVKIINSLESKILQLLEERENIQKAKEALELTEHGTKPYSEGKIMNAYSELIDLKKVWSELKLIWEKIEEMKELPWISVQPRKLRQDIDNLLVQMKHLPNSFSQYASHVHIRSLLQFYLKANSSIVELKSEAVKERHWRMIMRKLDVNWSLNELQLGNIWDIVSVKYEGIIREVLAISQGERAIEEYLRQISEIWKDFALELTNYQNKTMIIKGWDDLFNKIKEHVNNVTGMKASPYFKEFEEESNSWEDRLNKMNSVFDVWIDVQRRWIYLDGIFTGSADIKVLLPMESQRFQNVSTEILGLMRKVQSSPLVTDVLNIPNIQKQLMRLADLLGKIQKSLGEYLERQRASFPRFYFIGDEDLLEVIGNSKELHKLQKHFKKLFTGVHSIILCENEKVILGMVSKEGEELRFLTPIPITENVRINDWLTALEKEMRNSLAKYLAIAVKEIATWKIESECDRDKFMVWLDKYQAQIVNLAVQITWTESVEESFASGKSLEVSINIVHNILNMLADLVLNEQPHIRRQKIEHLIIEFVHQRDVLRKLHQMGVDNNNNFHWLSQMRFYFDRKQRNPLQQLSIHIANAKFNYGFEYLGIYDRLVQTPLTDRCYLTMTQALEARLGGSPFGPAGTGKTESVKSLGHQLGRFVLVFNCDETFDFQAMGRIFVGLCQVGAWGCFDEFNRLEERMLSAVSQQIQEIQEALRDLMISKKEVVSVELLGKNVYVNPDMAIFITMNPGYAGRSNLPDNLKKLFRSLAMTQPDRQLIAQVMLYSQGFQQAETLSRKVVPFFKLCEEQLSPQPHYDFGLRALKSVLISSGNAKREKIKVIQSTMLAKAEETNETFVTNELVEQKILIQSIMETMAPKLIADDIPLLDSLLSDVFPGVHYKSAPMIKLREEIRKVSINKHLVCSNMANYQGYLWTEKVLQLYQIINIHHGLMMVGPSGSGKTMACKVLLEALENVDGIKGVAHIIDPKSISKESLYGSMDPNTREWTDGLFTHILRKIIDNVRGEGNKRQWIIFDGDVDPEWVENLNSVLDDNKLLTLPNGERLGIPSNVRIMFEVQDLKYATLATVSRCGMVWFSEEVLTTEMILTHFLNKLTHGHLTEEDEMYVLNTKHSIGNNPKISKTTHDDLLNQVVSILTPYFARNGLIVKCLEYSSNLEHIMDFTRLRALTSLFSMIKRCIQNVIEYNQTHLDFPLEKEQVENYITKSLFSSIVWSMTGDSKLKIREQLSLYIKESSLIDASNVIGSIKNTIDFEVSIQGLWVPLSTRVPRIEIEAQKIIATDIVVPTVDTVRHETLLYTWLAEHRPVVLCGPPGSGKTMTLFSALRRLPDMEVVGLNFSSATTPELMLKTFDQYCEYRKTPNGTVLVPQQINKWLIFFCDEINLPDMDKYGTQRIISFLRQMIEYHGFYRISDMQWISLERIQFVGACNPPTDPGRKPLSQRFLRHVPIIYVDYPGEDSLKQIYSTFNRAMLRILPQLIGYSDTLTDAMVEFFLKTQERFTQDVQPHYIYSPREMTRWVRGIYEVLKSLESPSLEDLVRIWAHEALRLFQDRLVKDEERNWTDDTIDEIAVKYFPNLNKYETLKRPILYSNWLNRNYSPVNQEELRKFVKARLKVFYEEELDVPLVLFNQVLDHVLRIDRVFRQSQGHVLLIGVSGAGKTTLSRFVAWINGFKVFQVKVHKKYSAQNFDDDLRTVLRRSGCKGEKIAFIMDESNVKDSSFLERMNTLLANGEVPGLFEGDEYMTLMTQCKEGALHEGLLIDTNEELYKWFTQQICRNLHVIFTMNPSVDGLKNKACTSPALFNRCVLNWFGDWSLEAYFQVGKEFTDKLDLEKSGFVCPKTLSFVTEALLPPIPKYQDVVVNSLVFVHLTMHQVNLKVYNKDGKAVAITPRHFLDLIAQFIKLSGEKRTDLEEQQLHLKNGLKKIEQTVQEIESMQKSLTIKRRELENMNEAANMKLKQMVQDQQEAEQKKSTSHMLKKELTEQELYVNEKQKAVRLELDQVEPIVSEAKQAVQNIRKKDIHEIRAMKNPPNAVKLAVESICLLLGEKTSDWQSILKVIIRDNFVQNVLNFNSDGITDGIRDTLEKYVSNPDFTFEKVNKASNACGPMVKWVLAQISYAGILRRVEPLRNELNELTNSAKLNMEKLKETENIILELEEKIRKYTEEYAVLISQGQIIKSDLSIVEKKVNRSIALLHSLGAERSRWDNASESFKSQMEMINGDCLLSSAFITYGGYFDQQMRTNLFSTWCHNLLQAGILYRSDLSYTEYLSIPDDRLRWQTNGLPDDNLCVENAIILSRFNRYPLIIDPSDQAITYLMNEYSGKTIAKTSFLDDSFRKTLESSLRFGTPLLVQDVESYDPILNPILNKEIRRTGGRTLITLGDQDVDLSPTFKIFLSTRDPSVEFSSDICSRVTFVNFTVTRSSLQTQCLNAVLKVERPDINQKRLDLMKIQGEFHLRLRHLEKDLLQSLNESQGNLLENDIIITRLETLKLEAAQVAKKVEETDVIMQEVENVSGEYMPLAQSFSNIYFTLQSLNQIHYLYQYSLQFMLDIFSFVLTKSPELNNSQLPSERLKLITKGLFQITYNRVARGVLHSDQITFAMILTRIYLKGIAPDGFLESEFQHFIERQETAIPGSNQYDTVDYGVDFDQQQINSLGRLRKLKTFKNIGGKCKSLKYIQNWITSVNPETNVPEVWDSNIPNYNNDNENLTDIVKSMNKLLLVQAIRPDRLVNSVQNFISSVFGESFYGSVRKTLNLENIVKCETTSSIPILLCAVQGYDPSSQVEDLALEEGKQLSSIAIGSVEGFSQAEKAINAAIKSGGWVLFKNVHLSISWLTSLVKKIYSLSAHSNFRLFLSMEIMPKLPVNLLRTGRILVFEPPPGIKANLLRTFSAIPEKRMSKDPIERSRLYFMLAWFNAVVQERLRYVPLGYSKKYEFNESDFKCGLDTVDKWVDATAMDRTNLPAERIPWNALQTLLGSCIYGGKIDNVFDQKLLESFLKYLFSEISFRPEFSLISEINGKLQITFPESTKYSDILQWIHNLPDSQTPSWIELPNSAEKVLLINLGNSLIGNILKLHQSLENDEEIMVDQNKSQQKIRHGNGQPTWMQQLFQTTQEWLHLLPRSIVPLRRTTDNIKDPIYRCFEREIILGCKLLVEVRQDLEDIAEICNALKKPTNHHRSLMADLGGKIIPKSWIKYNVPSKLTVIQWINDFLKRVNQLIHISNIAINQGIQSFPKIKVWLGGLFMPEAYITAIRQSVAQSNKWPLEELFLDVELGEGEINVNTFVITGLKLMGCEKVDSKTLKLSTLIHTDLDICLLKWIRMKNDVTQEKYIENKVCLPVYLNAARSTILFTLYFHTSDSSYRFCKNGVAILSSSLEG